MPQTISGSGRAGIQISPLGLRSRVKALRAEETAGRGRGGAELRNCGRMGTSDPRPPWAVLGQAFGVSELVLTQIEAGGIEG